jgi:hypothetical protein
VRRLRGCNLLLVVYNPQEHRETFGEVARHVRQYAPDVRPLVVTDRRYRWHRIPRALRPTMVFSPVPLQRLRPLRGVVFQGCDLSKSEQQRALERLGLPVPRWTRLTATAEPDLAAFGPYVVTKPDGGMRGAYVKIKRKDRVRWKPPPDPLESGNPDWIVQEFIYTGVWPVTYRVSTLFGEVLYAMRGEASHASRPLRGRYAFAGGRDVGGASIVASARGSTWSLAEDPEVLALARRAHEAFPDIPLLGVDIIREHGTGRLYVLEANPTGWTWHFSSRMGREAQETFGFDLAGQFDGLRKAARVLADKARACAR